MNVAVPLTDLLMTRTDTVRGRSAMRARGIIEDVTNSIRTGALQPGDRLPDERSLCQRYAAGRHTVRKAMEALEGSGLVGRFVGRGSFVLAPPEPEPEPDSMPEASPARSWTLLELTEARLLLEPAVAMLAAERLTPSGLARLDRCLVEIDRAESWRGFKEAKYEFHRAVAQVAANDFICEIFNQMIASRRRAWDGYQPRKQDLANVRSSCAAECRAIRDALADGKAEAAAEAVRSSITKLLTSLSGS